MAELKTLSKSVEILVLPEKWPFFSLLIKYNDENILISTLNNVSVMNLQNDKLSRLPKETRAKGVAKKEPRLIVRISDFLMDLFRD